MIFRLTEELFRLTEAPFKLTEVLFRLTEVLFRLAGVTFRHFAISCFKHAPLESLSIFVATKSGLDGHWHMGQVSAVTICS